MDVKRIYAKEDVSDMTLIEVEDLIIKQGINFSGDFGFEVQNSVQLIHSEN
jgi:hypothetical protein